MRMPSRSLTVENLPAPAANRKVETPNPSGMISSAGAPESKSMSSPVMPTSSVPSPT